MSDERSVASGERSQVFSQAIRHNPLVLFLVAAMEIVLLALICLSPWLYGANNPGSEFLLDAGIAVLLVLWAVRMLVQGQITWKKSTVAICLAGLFLLSIWQTTPLPRSVLAWLSPGTARCYDQLLPQQPEIPLDPLTGEPAASPASSGEVVPAGSTLSLYPGATQREATRLLAVFLVFVVVLNNLTSKEALIRLSWAAVINGSLLSLFALFQFFSAPRYTVYWTYAAQSTPFGPFICKNHFPDYVNICIGLGIGLLLCQSKRDQSSAAEEPDFAPLQMLRNPRTLWLCGALGLMLTAVAFSCSRGGILALVGAAVFCGVVGRVRLGLSVRLGTILVVAGIVAAFFTWFGIDAIKDRLATLGTGEAFEHRIPLWRHSLPIVGDFPIWGTGYGTFGYIETKYRPDVPSFEGQYPSWYDHAHNDYLEILVEGGVLALCLAVLALVAVFRLGFRALAINRGSSRAGLALGALFGFTALALHSFADFGSHIPAITLLATVVCAHLCALGQSKPLWARSGNKDEELSSASPSSSDRKGKDVDGDTYRLRLGGIAPVLGGLVAVGFGLVICADSWKAHRIFRLEDAALRTGNDEADELRTRIACLTEAVALGPENAPLHFQLAFAHGRLAELLKGNKAPQDPLAALKWLAESLKGRHDPEFEQDKLALQEYLRARDACPLLSEAHAMIAAFTVQLLVPQGNRVVMVQPFMKQGDKAEDYLRRAKLLSPGRAETWYLCGLREIRLNRVADAFASWHHCLELSDQNLPQILDLIQPLLHAKGNPLPIDRLLEKVLPDNPEVLAAAALYLYPEFGSVQRRRPFLEKALRVLDAKEGGLGPQDVLVKARIYRALEQPDKSIPLYQEFLKRDPSQLRLRFELASYLREQRKWEEARRELTALLAREPKNVEAKELLDAVLRETVQDKSQERKRQRQDWWDRHRQRGG